MGNPRHNYVGHLTSIAFPTLGNLTRNLGPRVGTFPFLRGAIGPSHIIPCAHVLFCVQCGYLTNWRQFFMRLSCYWSWISSSHCQSSWKFIINNRTEALKTDINLFFSIANRPFPSSLLPLFQNESKCKTFHMKMNSACSFIFMQIKVIFIRMVSHLDSPWNRGTRKLGNGLLSNCRLSLADASHEF